MAKECDQGLVDRNCPAYAPIVSVFQMDTFHVRMHNARSLTLIRKMQGELLRCKAYIANLRLLCFFCRMN